MHYKIVKVIGKTSLLDPQSGKHSYRTASGRPLARGIYVTSCSSGIDEVPRYDAATTYIGPFASWTMASEFARSLSLGNSEPVGTVLGIAPTGSRDLKHILRKALLHLVERGWIKGETYRQ